MTPTLICQLALTVLFLQRVPSIVKLTFNTSTQPSEKMNCNSQLAAKNQRKPILLKLWYEYQLANP